MNILREVCGELLKMFVGDAWMTIGILAIASLTGLLTRAGTVPPLFGGVILFLGCILVLVASIVLAARRHRNR